MGAAGGEMCPSHVGEGADRGYPSRIQVISKSHALSKPAAKPSCVGPRMGRSPKVHHTAFAAITPIPCIIARLLELAARAAAPSVPQPAPLAWRRVRWTGGPACIDKVKFIRPGSSRHRSQPRSAVRGVCQLTAGQISAVPPAGRGSAWNINPDEGVRLVRTCRPLQMWAPGTN